MDFYASIARESLEANSLPLVVESMKQASGLMAMWSKSK